MCTEEVAGWYLFIYLLNDMKKFCFCPWCILPVYSGDSPLLLIYSYYLSKKKVGIDDVYAWILFNFVCSRSASQIFAWILYFSMHMYYFSCFWTLFDICMRCTRLIQWSYHDSFCIWKLTKPRNLFDLQSIECIIDIHLF